MIGRELLRDTLDQAVKIGRMTREDTEQLASVFMQVAGRQARDAVSGVRERVDRLRGAEDPGSEAD